MVKKIEMIAAFHRISNIAAKKKQGSMGPFGHAALRQSNYFLMRAPLSVNPFSDIG